MTTSSFKCKSTDNTELYGHCWIPSELPEKIICLVHGIGEHCRRYDQWATWFTENKIAVVAIDYRGHGQSEGKRGDSVTYDLLLNDIETLLNYTEKKFPDIPRILYGHSLGGNLVINYALKRNPEIVAVIATSPWLKLAFDIPSIKMALAKVVNKIFPLMIQSNGLTLDYLSHDEEIIKGYKNDKLIHNKISVRLFFAAFYSGIWALNNAEKLQIFFLLMHGSNDKITSCKASQEFAEKNKKFTTLKIWDGLFHELHNEFNKKEIFDFIIYWIKQK